jgi:hypothetical protein
MKTMNRQESQGRFFLLSIPDLIRDPEGRQRFIQRLGTLPEAI